MLVQGNQELDKIKASIIKFAQMLHQKNMLSAYDGNISCRYQDLIIITNSQTYKANLTNLDFAIIDLSGKVLSGNPSSESLMHLTAYRTSSQVKAIIHAHPIHAISLSIAKAEWTELPANVISELVIAAGKIPIVDYYLPGGIELANAVACFIPQHKLMILKRHGALTWGDNLMEAYIGMERLEHSAAILHNAILAGGLSTLSSVEYRELLTIRQKLGGKII